MQAALARSIARLGVALCLAGLAALPCLPAQAQLTRNIPAQAVKAQCTFQTWPSVLINGKARTLSAATQIRGADNLLLTAATLTGQSLTIKYTEDRFGGIDRIWILSAAEAAAS